jgi:glycosyltransferase involved in cell wall biosynthesis
MKIGIDLSSLQGPHRMRGIGYTLLNLINNIPSSDRAKHHFIFYYFMENDMQNPLDLIDVSGLSYETRRLRTRRRIQRKLPGRLNLTASLFNQLIEIKDLHFGDSRITDLNEVDFFLQTDQSQPLPRKKSLKKGLVIYDIIPYVLEWEYLWSYDTSRLHGFSRKAALRVAARRWIYAYKIRVNTIRADTLFSISEHTMKDFVTYLKVPKNKIIVTPLGINMPSETVQKEMHLKQYVKTSWGYIQRELDLNPHQRYLLYVGGADKRRKLDDLVTAFNRLQAEGHNLKLVLAGDSMKGPDNIATEEIQYALKTSSYIDDIIFMGFVDDPTREWLYNHAFVFVFPSKYEGFGLPILEAMSYGTPVICYDNAATREVAAACPHYVENSFEMMDEIKKRMYSTQAELKKEASRNVSQARKWRWQSTIQQMLLHIDSL